MSDDRPKPCGECAHVEPIGGHGCGCSKYREPEAAQSLAEMVVSATQHPCECVHPWSRHNAEGCLYCSCDQYRPVVKTTPSQEQMLTEIKEGRQG